MGMATKERRKASLGLLAGVAVLLAAVDGFAQQGPAEPEVGAGTPTGAQAPDAGLGPFATGEPPLTYFQPRLSLSETLTDNATGGTTAFGTTAGTTGASGRRGDLITRVSPGFAVNRQGP